MSDKSANGGSNVCDMKIRVFVFPARPDTILIHVPEDATGSLTLPPLPVPFDRGPVAYALGMAGVHAKVVETTPGRWTDAMDTARDHDKQARIARAKAEQVASATMMLGSSDDLERERAELLRRKQDIDEEIGKLKAELAGARRKAAARGVYLPRAEFAAMEQRLARMGSASLGLQHSISKVKKKIKTRNVAEDDASRADFLRAFMRATKAALDEETYRSILDEATRAAHSDDEERAA